MIASCFNVWGVSGVPTSTLSAFRSVIAAVSLQCALTCSFALAATFPTPEAYKATGTQEYLDEAVKFLNVSADSVYAPRVAFDALIHAKKYGSAGDLVGDLETTLLLDYWDSLHGGYYVGTLADPKIGRGALESLIRHDLKKPRADFPQKFAAALTRFLKQCGAELMEGHGFALQTILILEQADAKALRQDVLESFFGRLKSDDSEHEFAKDATDETVPMVDRVLALHKHSLDKNLTAASLRDLLLRRLPDAEAGSARMRFIRAEASIQGNMLERALQEYQAVKDGDFGDKEVWLRSWCHARIGNFKEATKGLNELKKRFPKSEYIALASEVIQSLLGGAELVDAYAKALGQMIDCAAKQTDSFHVRFARQSSAQNQGAIVFVNYSGPRNEFSTMMCDMEGKVLAGFRSNPREVVAFADGWDCIRRFDEAGYIPVPVLNLKLDDDENSFSFRSKTFRFGVPIPSPLLEVPWFADAENQKKAVRRFQKAGMCFAPVAKNLAGCTLKCIWPSVSGPKASEWLIEVSSEGRLLKVEADESSWEIRSGISVDEPFNAPAWPDFPMREGRESQTSFVEVFMKVLGGVMY